MSSDDFDEIFKELPALSISSAAREQHLRLIDELTKKPVKKLRKRRKFVIFMSAAIGFSATGLGTAVALGAFSAPPTDRRIAHCYTTTNLNDDTNREDFAVATSPEGTNPSLQDAAASAIEVCAGGWQQGRFSATDPKIRLDPQPAPWNYPVPNLVACVLTDGTVGVFPGPPHSCSFLGLPEAQL